MQKLEIIFRERCFWVSFPFFSFFVEEEVIPLTGKGSDANLVLIGVGVLFLLLFGE